MPKSWHGDRGGHLQEYLLGLHGNRLAALMIALETGAWDFIKSCQLHWRELSRVTLRAATGHGRGI